MKRWLATVAIAGICSIPLRADVTITQNMTAEGGAMAMSGANMQSRIVMRIKGLKARSDMEIMGVSMSTIADLNTNQLYVLRTDAKTAQLIVPGAAPNVQMPKMDMTFKPTGKSKTIQDALCDEYTMSMTINMAEITAGQQMPPEAAAMMQDARMIMSGSVWIAKTGPGTADYVAFQKAAASGGMSALIGGAFGGSAQIGKMMSAIAEAPGIAYLTEMTMSVEGTGQMVEMMKSMGAMKMTTAVSSISTDSISDDAFQVPPDYKIVK